MWSNRLDRRSRHALPGGLAVYEASDVRSRLLGLALLDELPRDAALLIPRCWSVHTFGMRFALDLIFFNRAGAVVRVVRRAKPRRAFGARAAQAVLEVTVGQAERFIDAGAGALIAG